MIYQITDIEFDFDYEDISEDDQLNIIYETKRDAWTSPTESQLPDIIADHMGFCVKSIAYELV